MEYEKLYKIIKKENLQGYFNNIKNLDGFFYKNERYGKKACIINEIKDITEFLKNKVLTINNINAKKLYNFNSTELQPKFDIVDKLITFLGNISNTRETSIILRMKDFIIKSKVLSVWLLSQQNNNIEFKYKDTETNNYIEIEDFSNEDNKLQSIMKLINSKESEQKYSDETMNNIRNMSFYDICEILLNYDKENYNNNILSHQLSSFHYELSSSFESLLNGYRGILWDYFIKLGRLNNNETEINNFLQNNSIYNTFRDIILKSIKNNENIVRGYHFNTKNTINDSRFLLSLFAGFLNLPHLSYFVFLTILNRTYFSDNYRKSYVKDNKFIAFTPNLLQDMVFKSNGYIIPAWPFTNDIERIYPGIKPKSNELQVKKLLKFKRDENGIPLFEGGKVYDFNNFEEDVNKFRNDDIENHFREYNFNRKYFEKARFNSNILISKENRTHLMVSLTNFVPFYFHFNNGNYSYFPVFQIILNDKLENNLNPKITIFNRNPDFNELFPNIENKKVFYRTKFDNEQIAKTSNKSIFNLIICCLVISVFIVIIVIIICNCKNIIIKDNS